MEVVGQDSIVNHLTARHFDVNKHKAWIGEETATFPISNLSGQLIGYQQYRPGASKEPNNDPHSGRYFTRLARDRVGVWGLESWKYSSTLFICEGVFDACKLTWLGLSAISLFSNRVSPTTASWLAVVRAHRRVVALCDSDEAGLGLARYAHRYYQFKDWKDAGEAPLSHVVGICRQFNED
jgi:hypothetical protein